MNAGSEMVVDGRPKSPVQLNEDFMNGGKVLAAAAAAAAAVVAASSSGAKSGGGGSSAPSDDRSDRDNGEFRLNYLVCLRTNTKKLKTFAQILKLYQT